MHQQLHTHRVHYEYMLSFILQEKDKGTRPCDLQGEATGGVKTEASVLQSGTTQMDEDASIPLLQLVHQLLR